jgi:hypothetical protein
MREEREMDNMIYRYHIGYRISYRYCTHWIRTSTGFLYDIDIHIVQYKYPSCALLVPVDEHFVELIQLIRSTDGRTDGEVRLEVWDRWSVYYIASACPVCPLAASAGEAKKAPTGRQVSRDIHSAREIEGRRAEGRRAGSRDGRRQPASYCSLD